MESQALSLYELLGRIRTVLKNNLPGSYWITAEIGELKVNYSGHCYLELIEKESSGESIKAKARATIWSSVFRMVQPYFETTTKVPLAAGIRIMVKVNPEFHEHYGFSLNITDIEPAFTVGELALQKQAIINRLVAEGVFDMNRSLPLPELPGRVALISSKTAAGLGDFMDQLTGNLYGYRFSVKLFPAIMQGDEAEQSIIRALDQIFMHENLFDVVVLIRGGGSQSDLNCFNSYLLASHICQFPLPILTGIGHEQDETIADLVANKRLKTPTAVAEFLIEQYRQADDRINELSMALVDLVTEKVKEEKDRLNRLLLLLMPAVREQLSASAGNLKYLGISLSGSVKQRLVRESGIINSKIHGMISGCKDLLIRQQHRIEMQVKRNDYLNPFHVLKRGYSITYHKGRALKDPLLVPRDEIIETRLADGMIKSKTI